MLLPAPRPQQDEPVRIEELAEVDIGQEPGVARVAGALEAVDWIGLQRIDGRELVDHEHLATRTGDAGELGEHELGAPNVVERPERAREIERCVLEREARRITLRRSSAFAGARSRASARSSGT